MPRRPRNYEEMATRFPEMLVPLHAMDPNLTATINELVDYINVRAHRMNMYSDTRRGEQEPTISGTTLRRYVEKGLIEPKEYVEQDASVTLFGPDAAAHYKHTAAPGSLWTATDLSRLVGRSLSTIQDHHAKGLIQPTEIEPRSVRVALFGVKDTLDYWLGKHKEIRRLARPESWEEKQRRLPELNKPKRDRTDYNEKKKRARQPVKLDFELTPEERTARERNKPLPKPQRIIEPTPEEAAAERARILALVRGESPSASPPPPEPLPATAEPNIDVPLKPLEAKLDKTNYRFLIRGVTQLKTDGASFEDQKAFIDEYMTNLDAEADEYEGEEID